MPTPRPGGSCAGTSGSRTCPGWTGTACWTQYRPLLDRIRGAGRLRRPAVGGDRRAGHLARLRRARPTATRAGAACPPSGSSVRTCPATRRAAGWWTGCCPASRPTRGPARRWPRRAWPSGPGMSWSRWTGSRSTRCAARAAAGRDGGQAGRADHPAPGRPRPGRVVVVPLRDECRLRYQDWVAGRRRLVRELSDGPAGLPAHPGHDGGGLGPLPPRPAHRDAVRTA